jgi:RNA polymerase sigma factor (sigma-70 family)
MSPRVSVRLLRTQSDARLVELARAGHERAFEALVERYRQPLLGYCRRQLLPHEHAEDATQQGLLQAWLALRGGTEVRDVKPWLYSIVHNTALNMRRSGYDYAQLSATLSGADAPPEDLDRRIAVRQTLTGLAALPEVQREALLRTAVDGSSYQATATALGVSEGAVRGLVYRARVALRTAMTALTPSPLLSWTLGSGGADGPLAGRLAGAGAGGSAGLVTGMLKLAATAATVGVVASGIGVSREARETSHKHALRPAPAEVGRSHVSAVLAPAGGRALALVRERTLPTSAARPKTNARGGRARALRAARGSRRARHRDAGPQMHSTSAPPRTPPQFARTFVSAPAPETRWGGRTGGRTSGEDEERAARPGGERAASAGDERAASAGDERDRQEAGSGENRTGGWRSPSEHPVGGGEHDTSAPSRPGDSSGDGAPGASHREGPSQESPSQEKVSNGQEGSDQPGGGRPERPGSTASRSGEDSDGGPNASGNPSSEAGGPGASAPRSNGQDQQGERDRGG